MAEMIVEHGGVEVSGYLSEPEGAVRGGMVVIQEWWGLTPDIKEIADRYALEGYLAFAPDLYHGDVAEEPAEAMKLAMAMERDLAGQEIDAVIGWLKEERGAGKVGCSVPTGGASGLKADSRSLSRGRGTEPGRASLSPVPGQTAPAP